MKDQGTLTTMVNRQTGTITLCPDDKFRWNSQKTIWKTYRMICDVLGIVAFRGRLKRNELDRNSERLAQEEGVLLSYFEGLGIPRNGGYCHCEAMMHQLLGSRLTGSMPSDPSARDEYIRNSITEKADEWNRWKAKKKNGHNET